MKQIMAWLEDKKNLPYVIGGGVGVIVIMLVLMFMSGGGGRRQVQPGTGQGMGMPGMGMMKGPGMGGGAGGGGMPGMGMAGMGMGGAGMPGMGGGSTQGMPGMGGMAVAAAPKSQPPVEKIRSDPFAPEEGKEVSVAQQLAGILPSRDLFRRKQLPPPGPVTPQVEVLSGVRMAGLLWGERVSAVLDWGGDMRVVRPGSLVDGWRVEKIERDSMLLRRGNQRARVTMQASIAGTPGAGMPGMGGGAGGGMPGMMRPGGSGVPGGGQAPDQG